MNTRTNRPALKAAVAWPTRILTYLALGACAVSPALAQSQGAPNSDSDEVIELSPFLVTELEARGYEATSTLAGTRLRTSLEDVSTSISIVTEKFMQDTASTDAKSLLVYTLGTEVSGPGGNFSGADLGAYLDEGEIRRNPAGSNRVRGLAAADLARDFFATDIPFDSYNTSRVEINRGSNSILFGLGSPAGIVNNSTKTALFKNSHSLDLSVSSYGSSRGVADVNRVIIPKHLAVRLIALEENDNYEQKPAFERDSRLFFGLNARPFADQEGALRNLSIRGNYERGRIDANRPRTSPPSDSITPWFQPWSSASSPKFSFDPGNVPYSQRKSWEMAPLSSLLRNPNVVYSDEHSSLPRDPAATAGQNIIGRQFVLSNWTFPSGARTTAVHGGITGLTGALRVMPDTNQDYSFYSQPSITDPSIFDFRHKLLDGPNKYEDSEFEAWNVTLEQLFMENRAGIELTFDHQMIQNWNYALIGDGRSATLTVETATTMIDGTPNTNFGRAFVEGTPRVGYNDTERDAWRATAFYDLDFAKNENKWLARLLGRHVLTAVVSGQDREGRSRAGPDAFGGDDFIWGTTSAISNGQGPQFGAIHYLGGSLAGLNSAAGANIPALSVERRLDAESLTGNGAVFFLKGQAAGDVPVVTPLQVFNNDRDVTVAPTAAALRRDEVDSLAFVTQSYLWDDLLVGTMGWRKDKLATFDAGAAPLNANGSRDISASAFHLPTTPDYADQSETFSWGLALHAPSFLTENTGWLDRVTLYYNKSSNFQPTTARYNIYNERIDSPQGETEDIGIGFSMFDGKLSARATWYETNQVNVTEEAITSTIANIVSQGWVRVIETTRTGFNPDPDGDGLPTESGYVAPPQSLLDAFNAVRLPDGSATYSNPGNIVGQTTFQSKGFELELVYNPTRQWTFALNVARQESRKDDSGAALQKFYFEDPIGPGGESLYELWTSPAAANINVTQGGFTLQQTAETTIANAIRRVVLQDGQAQAELREWRANLVTNYEFAKDSVLKGVNVGAAYRWQSKAAIGYPVIDGPDARVIDVANPYFGPPEDDLDMWVGYERPILRDRVQWRIQLNVRNLLDDDNLVPLRVQPDGTAALFRIPASRTWELSTRFSF